MLSYLNIEFHTIIISFVMTVLVSGCVFMYFRTRVSRVEEMIVSQTQAMKNLCYSMETIRHERVLENTGRVGMMNDGGNKVQANHIDNRMDVSDDGESVRSNNIELEINEVNKVGDDESTSTYDGSSDSEEVDDTDMSESGDEMDHAKVVEKVMTTSQPQSHIVATQEPLPSIPTTVNVIAPEDDLSTSVGSTSSTRMTKKALCEKITSLKISTRSIGTLMKLKRDELASMLEESGLE